MLRVLVLSLLVLCATVLVSAQVGISSLYHLEVDTVAINIGTVYENSGPVDLTGYNTYRVYLAADSTAEPQSVAMVGGGSNFGATSIETTTSFFQHSLGGVVPTSTDGLTDFFPALEYDSWVTIGIDGLANPLLGESPILTVDSDDSEWRSSFDPGGGLPGESFVIEEIGAGGSWFITNGVNGMLNPGGRVLLGQFTTDGTFSGQMAVGFLTPGSPSNLILTLLFGEQEGCTDPDACNYQSYATLDDCSCLYEDVQGVCGGNCVGDQDSDGLCDEVDPCSLVLFGGPAIDECVAVDASDTGHRMMGVLSENEEYDHRDRLITATLNDGVWTTDTVLFSPLVVDSGSVYVNSIDLSASGAAALVTYKVNGLESSVILEQNSDGWTMRGDALPGSPRLMSHQGDKLIWYDLGNEPGAAQFEAWDGEGWVQLGTLTWLSDADQIRWLSDVLFSGDGQSGFAVLNRFVNGWIGVPVYSDLVQFVVQGDSVFWGDTLVYQLNEIQDLSDVSYDGNTVISHNKLYEYDFDAELWTIDFIGAGSWTMDSDASHLMRKQGDEAVLYARVLGSTAEQNRWSVHPSGLESQLPELSEDGESFVWSASSPGIPFGPTYLIGTGCSDLSGCMDPLACNFSLAANQDDGTCQFLDVVGICGGGCTSDLDEDGLCDDVDGCSDTTACNYWLCNALECQYLDGCGLCGGMAPEGADCDCPDGVIDVLGNCGGTCLSDTNGNGVCDDEECLCGEGTVWSAETSRCELETPIEVTMMAACGPGTVWDSTAEQCLPLPDLCPSDVDSDGYVAINDLLTLLSSFATACPE